MIWQLFSVFVDVIVPVFLLVGLGYWLGPKLKLQAQTLSRTAYYILTPAFTYTALSQAELQSELVLRMIAFSALLGAALALLALGAARLLRRPAGVAGALVMTAVFSNVGNLGLSLTEFRLGSAALLPATVYFLAIMTTGFVAGVGAASWASGRQVSGALLDVLKTPALLALLPAMLVNTTGWQVPLLVTRATGLLAQATIPVMLLTLGVQLAGVARPRITVDVLVASGVRLLGGPLVSGRVGGRFWAQRAGAQRRHPAGQHAGGRAHLHHRHRIRCRARAGHHHGPLFHRAQRGDADRLDGPALTRMPAGLIVPVWAGRFAPAACPANPARCRESAATTGVHPERARPARRSETASYC